MLATKISASYGYGICGLNIRRWILSGISSKCSESEILSNYYTSPVQQVGLFCLDAQENLERKDLLLFIRNFFIGG